MAALQAWPIIPPRALHLWYNSLTEFHQTVIHTQTKSASRLFAENQERRIFALDMTNRLAEEFHLRPQQVQNTIDLIDQGNTIPFIARYRKEMTGSLDDQLLRELSDRKSVV